MYNGIQEEEMHITVSFLREYDHDLTVLLNEQTSLYRTTYQACKDKIEFETKEVFNLEKKLARCNDNIAFNNDRIQVIPGEIKNLEQDIAYCEETIPNIEIPVYRDEYDDISETWHTYLDAYATERNREFRDSLIARSAEDKSHIQQLKAEQIKRANNIKELQKMIVGIKECIYKKKMLIEKIQKDIGELDMHYRDLSKKISDSRNVVSELVTKVYQCAGLIRDWGAIMSTISYKSEKVTYDARSVFAVTAADMQQEIKYLSQLINDNKELIRKCAKSTAWMSENLESKVTDIAKERTIYSIKELKNINDHYTKVAGILKRAHQCLELYELVSI